MEYLLLGFLTGLSLILAIGAQNVFVIEQGLKKQYVFIVCLICSISDFLLIFLGIFLFQYLNNDNKQHPVSGLKIIFNQKKIQNALIQNKKFNINKSYYVLTSNFLQEGGDKMDFFINPLELYNLETNIREVVIKHITVKKKIEGKLDNRIQRIK